MRRSVALFTLLRIRFWTANEKKNRYFWMVPEPLVQQFLKKTLGLWGREWSESKMAGQANVQLESKHLEKVRKGTSLIFYHDNMSCLLGNSFLFTPKIYLKYFFFRFGDK